MEKVIAILLTAIITYLFTKKKMDLSDKRKAYSEYLIALQNYINNNDFTTFQIATNNILLFASENTAKLVNKYFANATTLNKDSLSSDEHKKAHDEIIKSMRKDLGFIKNKIGECSLYRYNLDSRINKKQEAENDL